VLQSSKRLAAVAAKQPFCLGSDRRRRPPARGARRRQRTGRPTGPFPGGHASAPTSTAPRREVPTPPVRQTSPLATARSATTRPPPGHRRVGAARRPATVARVAVAPRAAAALPPPGDRPECWDGRRRGDTRPAAAVAGRDDRVGVTRVARRLRAAAAWYGVGGAVVTGVIRDPAGALPLDDGASARTRRMRAAWVASCADAAGAARRHDAAVGWGVARGGPGGAWPALGRAALGTNYCWD